MNQSSTFADSKRHYKILDGLRGVAAITVVLFHIFETFALGDHNKQIINHGYLAVDFFFLLSGFVIGYAYDDRWSKMSLGDFFKRRLIRLHPMIIMGMLIGAVMFYFQDSSFFPNIHNVSIGKLLLVAVIGCTLIPVPVSMDIRGWQEMHPLDGPAWSLFFEYVANILYALIVRRFSKGLLFVLVLIAGAALIHLAVTNPHGDVIGGWSLVPEQFRIGITRLMYPFFAGLLLQRVAKIIQIKQAFLLSSILLLVVLGWPRIGNDTQPWINGLYDSLCIVLVFPLIVYIGASGELKGGAADRICKFLGDISYPLYIIHYPFIYTFMAWVANNPDKIGDMARDGVPSILVVAAAITFIVSIVVAWASLKLYDEPLRKRLTKKFMSSK